ncbi:MAG TPA: hypothetical protein VNH22_03600 [Blastocatellia bacterium]|jgi:hypothetical protein|nr:hypothetical protein [Blastocatellia bacterium]
MKRSRSRNAVLFLCATTFISSGQRILAARQVGPSEQSDHAPVIISGVTREMSGFEPEPPLSRVGLKPTSSVVLFEMGRINLDVIREFKKVWRLSGVGINSVEGFVKVLLKTDGTYDAQSLGLTNEYKKFTFKWDPQTVAIAHTHPNNNDPRPSGPDLDLSDRYRIPIFTLTNRGMYMYDPLSRKITQLHKGLDWLNPSKWASERLG